MFIEHLQEDDKLGNISPIDVTMGLFLGRGYFSHEIEKGTIKPSYPPFFSHLREK